MNKIKEFFQKIINNIAHFFTKLWDKIKAFFAKLAKTKPMQAIGKVLGFIPNWLSKSLRNDTKKILWGLVFILPLIIGFIYFFAIPLVTNIIYSFSYVKKFDSRPGLTTIFVGWNNYKYIFKDFTISVNYKSYQFPELLLKAFTDIITDLPVVLIFSLLMAVVLNSKFTGRTLVRAIFFMPVIFNSQAIDIASAAQSGASAMIDSNTESIFETIFSFKDFLMNANLPPALVGFLTNASDKIYDIISYSGIQIIIFLSAIQSVPKHLYEAAKMEGATQYEMFWKITFPMVSPMLLTTAVYTIIDSYSRSPMVKAINTFTNSKSQKTIFPTLTDKAATLYCELSGFAESEFVNEVYELSNYGIGAALSLMYSILVILIIAMVLGILSKAVFYYDN